MESAFLKKACSFCIYQERTQQEVREKLKSWGVNSSETEEIITWLILENFINEERFAKQYAGSKFRVKKWGRRKIIFELKGKGLSDYCIKRAMKEISAEDYLNTIQDLAKAKRASLSESEHIASIKQKTVNYLSGKGFEHEEIFRVIEKW